MTRHASCHRVNSEFNRHTFFVENLGQLPNLVLGLGYRHAIAGDDDYLAGEGHENARILGLDLFHYPFYAIASRRCGVGADAGKEHIDHRPVHGLRH